LANEWHSDHIFKHDPGAIECFLLVAFLAYNIFHVFLTRNVKPAVRRGKAEIFWARLIAAELYSEVVPAGMFALRFFVPLVRYFCSPPGSSSRSSCSWNLRMVLLTQFRPRKSRAN